LQADPYTPICFIHAVKVQLKNLSHALLWFDHAAGVRVLLITPMITFSFSLKGRRERRKKIQYLHSRGVEAQKKLMDLGEWAPSDK